MTSSEEDLVNYYSKLINDLNTHIEDNPDADIDKFRRDLCGLEESSKTCSEMVGKFRTDLDTSSIKVGEKLCKLIAELAKDETCRDCFVANGFFPPINKHLENSLKFPANDQDSSLLKTQICRAIGNLCYYNDEGRLAFLNSCGIKHLIELYTSCSQLNAESSSEQDRTLVSVVLGCIHNLTNENDTLRNEIYSTQLIPMLKDFIPFAKLSRAVRIHFVSLIENLIETDQGKKKFSEEKLALKIYETLDERFLDELEKEYFEEFFDFLATINEIEHSNEFLCETDFLEKLLDWIEVHSKDEEDLRHVGLYLTKLAIQDNVDCVFSYRNGMLLNRSIEWLGKFTSEQLYVTSAVIMANYMRSDEKVMELMKHKSSPHKKLLSLLSNYSKSCKTATLQEINVTHSLLGSLRNFCVCQSSRDELVESAELLPVVSTFLVDSDNYEIIMKCLTVLRFLIRTAARRSDIKSVYDEACLSRLDEITSIEQHVGVKNELSRLVCQLPLAAATKTEFKPLFDRLAGYSKLVELVVNQLASEHLIMINEALLALNVIVTVDYSLFKEKLKASNMHKNLLAVLKKEQLPNEVKLNIMKIVQILFDKSDFFDNQQLSEIIPALKRLKLSISVDFIRAQIDQMINLLENAII